VWQHRVSVDTHKRFLKINDLLENRLIIDGTNPQPSTALSLFKNVTQAFDIASLFLFV